MKIYITGCAKTGTTLVRRLFQAFDLTVNPIEQSLIEFVNSDWDVAKRTVDSILSNEFTSDNLHELDILDLCDVKIINVVRNKRDTLSSSNGYVSVGRYTQSLLQAGIFRDIIDYTIHFERLMEMPDEVQSEIAELLGLTIKHKWSEYPKFVDLEGERFTEGQYGLRPIGGNY